MFQGRVIGNVARKECTTLFHSFPQNYSDVYFLHLECQESLKHTFSEPVNILALPGNEPPESGSVALWHMERILHLKGSTI